MTDLKHDDTDLRARFGALASDLDLDGGDLTAVRARGDQRRRRQHVGTGLAGIIAIVAAVGIATQLMPNRQIDLIETPDVVESPTETPDSGLDDGPVQSAGWEYLHVRFGEEGLTRYQGVGDRGVQLWTEPVVTAIAVPDANLEVLFQPTMEDPEIGGPIMVASNDGAIELVEAAPGQRLAAYRESDQTVWYFRWLDAPDTEFGSEQHLYSIALDGTDTPVDHGAIGDPNASVDAIAFGRGASEGSMAWTAGHLQTSLYLGSLQQFLEERWTMPSTDVGGWLGGVAFSPGGEVVATTDGADPNLPEETTSELIVVDLNGLERSRVELPTKGIGFYAGQISFGLGAQAPIAVGEGSAGSWVVDGWADGTYLAGPATRVRPMDGVAGVSLFGGRGQVSGQDDAQAAAPYLPVFYPFVGVAAYEDHRDNGDRLGTWRTSALDVTVSFLENELGAASFSATDRPAEDTGDGYHRTLVDVWLDSDAASSSPPDLVVSLRRIGDSASWWVDGVEPVRDADLTFTADPSGWPVVRVSGSSTLRGSVGFIAFGRDARHESFIASVADDGTFETSGGVDGEDVVAIVITVHDDEGRLLTARSVTGVRRP